MAYDEWDSPFQDFFDEIPGTDYLDDDEQRIVEALFEEGFTHTAEEYEAMGLSEDEVQAIRDEFFDYMGLEEYEFDWEGWREAMGYE
jgi:hypothetical protein